MKKCVSYSPTIHSIYILNPSTPVLRHHCWNLSYFVFSFRQGDPSLALFAVHVLEETISNVLEAEYYL